ncbi:Uncharacterised protein [uncultured archaeon]|nr:Uncharacterised protein [uncultured archaeon]
MSIIGDYITHQKGLFQSALNEIINSSKQKSYPINDERVINWNILFTDESALEAWETILIKNNKIEMIKYGYEYRRPSGFFFFYELDKEGGNKFEKLKKPKYHLHVGVTKECITFAQQIPELIEHRGPHYKVPPVTIDEIVGIIVLNFFPDNTDLLDKLNI